MAKEHGKRPYIRVFVGLAVLTAIEVAVAGLALDDALRIFILLGLAAVKAALVALFYMHLRYDHRLLAVIGGFPFLLVVIMLIILMADRVIKS
ncbi:MAG TPA: cytochrome C oxidase subunit IV family protein [Anaerolineales bacterium]|nr:cytochrome C oxidase subunit IV family protein [Anaerolineales bacterium]